MAFPRVDVAVLCVGVLASVASGCGGATESAVLATSYDLVSFEGQTLPATTRRLIYTSTQPGSPGYSCDDRLIGMNLRFVADNGYTQNESRLLVCDDGRPDVLSSSFIQGTYALGEGTLELNADLGGGFTQQSLARFSGNGLIVYRREIRNGTLTTVNGAPLVFLGTP